MQQQYNLENSLETELSELVFCVKELQERVNRNLDIIN